MKNLLLLAITYPCLAISVLTGNYNVQRTNANTSEVVITPSNVGTLAPVGCYTVDERVYAQPLVIDGVAIGGASRVVLIATMNDSVYLFNARQYGAPGSCASAYIWKVNLGTGYSSGTYTAGNFGTGLVGCEPTPVVDQTNAIVYALCNDSGTWKMNALNLADGTAKFSARSISGSNNGVTFGANQNSRPGLLLLNGEVYCGFSAYVESGTFNGYVFAINASTGTIDNIWADTNTNGGWAGIWESGGGFSTDGTNIYLSTGNGTCNNTDSNYAEAIVKLSPTLGVLSFFSAADCSSESTGDFDFASQVIVVGSQLVSANSEADIVLLAQSNLGGRGATPPQTWQLSAAQRGPLGGLAFCNNNLYTSRSGAPILRFAFNGSTFNTTAAATVTPAKNYFPGAQFACTSNGASNGILWAMTNTGTNQFLANLSAGTLTAYDASTLTSLWSSGTGSNALGNLAKFNIPTIANGQVFAPTADNKIMVYGLPGGTQTTGSVTFSGGVTIQ